MGEVINNFENKDELNMQIKKKVEVAMTLRWRAFIANVKSLPKTEDPTVFKPLNKIKDHMVKYGRTGLTIRAQKGEGGEMFEEW